MADPIGTSAFYIVLALAVVYAVVYRRYLVMCDRVGYEVCPPGV